MLHETLSKLLTPILSAVITGLQSYCDTSYSRGGVNQMWNLKNSKDLLNYIHTARSLSSCNSINTFDFFTFYTTIPHSKLKDRLTQLVQPCFIKMNGQLRNKYLVLRRDKSYFVIIKTTLIPPKYSLNLLPSKCSSFGLTTYLLYLWIQTVPLFSPTCFFIGMNFTSYTVYWDSQEKLREAILILELHVLLYRWCPAITKWF